MTKEIHKFFLSKKKLQKFRNFLAFFWKEKFCRFPLSIKKRLKYSNPWTFRRNLAFSALNLLKFCSKMNNFWQIWLLDPDPDPQHWFEENENLNTKEVNVKTVTSGFLQVVFVISKGQYNMILRFTGSRKTYKTVQKKCTKMIKRRD